MKTINLTVTGQVVTLDTQVLHVEGSVGLYNVATSYDSDWDDVTRKVLIFIATWVKKCGKPATKKVAIEDTGEPVEIPAEMLANVGTLAIGVIGYNDDGSLKITTTDYGKDNTIEIHKAISDTTNVSPSEVVPDIWTQVLNEIGNLSNLKTENKSNLVAAINEIFEKGGSGAVQSVNGKTGKVVLNATDVGAATPSTVTNAVRNEANARQAADNELSSGIATVANGLVVEKNAREQADNTLTGSVNTINGKIPAQASTSNQLADKAFVNSSVQTATANFRGNWDNWTDVPTDASLYPVDYAGSTTPTVNDYMVLQDASDFPVGTGEDPLTGTWRFKYSGEWDTDGKSGWHPEYQVNETPLTSDQLAALNSGITATAVTQIGTNASDIANLQTDMAGKQDTLTAGQNITIDPNTNTISATDTTYSDFTGTDGATAGTAGLVPAPATTDAGKFLKADGTWDSAGGGTLYTTTGANEDGAMTQKATSNLVYPVGSETTKDKVFIGADSAGVTSGSDNAVCVGFGTHGVNRAVALGYQANKRVPLTAAASYGDVAIGFNSISYSQGSSGGTNQSVCIGNLAGSYLSTGIKSLVCVGAGAGNVNAGANCALVGARTNTSDNSIIYSVALGSESKASRNYEVSVGKGDSSSHGTRYLANVKDPSLAQDAATKNYVDGTVLYSDSTGTAGNVTLSESASNFRKLEITYIRRNRTFMATVASSGDVAVFGGWTGSYVESGSTIYQADFEIENMNINGTTITRQSRIGLYGDSTAGGNFSVSGGDILNVITKVVGYK